MKCSIDGCDRPVHQAGWCSSHYNRNRRYGSPLGGGPMRPKRAPVCSVEGCTSPHKAQGLCVLHYARWQNTGDPLVLVKQRRVCTVDECERFVQGHGYCSRHYRRWRLYGDPLATRYNLGTPEERFWARVRKTSDCWLWEGSRDSSGYGTFNSGTKTVSAHRYVLTLHGVTAPAGLEVDHLCTVRHCVNPAHLSFVTHEENIRRTVARGNWATGKKGRRVTSSRLLARAPQTGGASSP